MNLKVTRWPRLSLNLLLLWHLAGGTAAALTRQQQGEERGAANRNAPANVGRGKFSVKSRGRYFLGEAPVIALSITNTGRSPQTLKEAEHQKFSFEVTGTFQNAARQETKTLVYDGSWDIPKGPVRYPAPGEMNEWTNPKKREPRYVNLSPGESTDLMLNLSDTFRSYLGVGKYHMIVTSEDGQRVVKDFEVSFDDEQSFPIMAKMLVSDDEGARNWALSNLVTFGRPRLVTLLEGLAKSGDEKQRDFAREILTKLSNGHFDAAKLVVENKERYFLGEAIVIAVSIKNGGSDVLSVKAAEHQKFTFELVKTGGADSKTCAYDGGRDADKSSAGRDKRKPTVVKLGETDSTTLNLNLFNCLRSRLDAGRYELAVTADDEPTVKGRRVVKTFEVSFDEGKSVPALAQFLKSDDAAEQKWAVSGLAQFSRPKLITLLEELVKTGSAKQRDFATKTLQDIKAGRFGPNTSSLAR